MGTRRTRRKQGRPEKDTAAVGREALIAAARKLFKSVPANQVTRLNIANAAGVDPALIRYYFGDKDALLAAAFLEAGKEMRETMRTKTAEAASPADKIKRRIRTLLAVLFQDPSLHHLIIEKVIHNHSKSARDLRQDMIYGTCKDLAAIIEDGVASGELRKVDPRHLYLALVGACSFPMAQRTLFAELVGKPPEDSDVEAYADFVSELFVEGLMPRARNGRRP